MYTSENTLEIPVKKYTSYYYIAHFSFFLYMFFSIYGTSLPFQPSLNEVDTISTSNIVNQVAYSFLFLTSLFSLIPKWHFVISLIRREKFIFLFLLWCAVTLVWSPYPFISFKRLFQFITTFMVSLAVLSHSDSSEETFKQFKILLSVYVVVSIATIFTIPGAKDEFGLWRGLAPNKNHLGQVSLISIIFFTKFILDSPAAKKIFFLILALIALALFIGASSFTTVVTLVIILGLIFARYMDKQFNPIGIKNTISLIFIVFFVGLLVSLLFLAPSILSSIAGDAGKDLTLTGRTQLWGDIFAIAKTHILFGYGFQGFWVVDALNIQALYQTYIWIPIQSHNGYLDILNETGLVGLILFIAVVINFFVNLSKYEGNFFWKWFFIAALIINITESTLIRPNIPSGVLLIFSYLALFSDLKRQEGEGSFEETE